MIDWLMIAQAIIIAVFGAVVLVAGIAKRMMNDMFLLFAGIAFVSLIVQVVASIIAQVSGNGPTGDPFEYWVYLVPCALIPPAAAFWALVDKGRWGVIALGVALLGVAVMVYRMHQIWFIQVA